MRNGIKVYYSITYLEFVRNHVAQTLVMDDARKYTSFHHATIDATVKRLSSVVIVSS